MENEKLQVDEKTAKMIEEMDKSLKNMEQTLGMDHPVLAKLLDSYATLLRQNNLRPLDALNMEARAKAIRAKNNQKEAQKQSEGLAETKQEKHMSASQLRLISQAVAAVLACGFLAGGYQMYKWFDSQKGKKNVKLNIKGIQYVDTRKPSNLIIHRPLENQQDTPPETEGPPGAEESSSPSGSETEQPPREQSTSTSNPINSSSSQGQDMSEKIQGIKDFAKEKLASGQAAESDKDFPKASAFYFEAIQQVQNTPQTVGRPVYSEEIAKCYEGYGRMAELDAHPDIARQCEQTAADIRSHL